MQRMKDGNLGRVNKGITYSHVRSLSSEEYDVKNDDNKRKKEKGTFSSSLYGSRIYLLQERQGSTFHSFPLHSISFSSFTKK